MTILQQPPEEKFILYNVSWGTYESLLADFANSSTPRLTYDRGTLEIMSPLPVHERYNHWIGLLVDIVAEERNMDVESLGSATFKRADMERGFEPDSCFYFRDVQRIRGKDWIDLAVDSPPDLVVEIEITSPSLDKLPIYAQFGVPEVWRYDGVQLTILILADNGYRESNESHALPGLQAADLSRLLDDAKTQQRPVWLRKVRNWARQQGGPGG